MFQRWWFPSGFALLLAFVMLGPVLGPGALLNLDLVGVEHWPTPRSMWGIGPELPRSVPAELLFSTIAWLTSGATAMKCWFVLCISGSFLTMFRLLRGMEVPALAWYAGGVAYAVNPFLLTRLAVGHTTLAGVYAIAPLVLPIVLRGASRRPQVVLASAALAFMGFFGGLVWGIATVFGLASGRRFGDTALAASFAMHLPWLLPSLFLLGDGPGLATDDVFRPGGGVADTLSLATGYGFWQPVLEVGTGNEAMSAFIGAIILGLAALGAAKMQTRFGPSSFLLVFAAGSAIAILNRTGGAIDWLFDLPGSSVLREPHRFLVLVIWWIVPASILGARRLFDELGTWSNTTPSVIGLTIPTALLILLVVPAVWGLHDNLEPSQVPTEWDAARELTQTDPGTILVLPWDRYIDVSFAGNRRVLNPALRYFGPDIIHGGRLGLEDAPDSAETGEVVDSRLPTLRPIVAEIATGTIEAQDFVDHGIRWILVLHEVDYRGFLSLTGVAEIEHALANEHLDLFRISVEPSGSWDAEPLGGRFAGYVAPANADRALASPSGAGWIGTDTSSKNGLPLLPAGSSAWHYRSFVVLGGWLISALALVTALRRNISRWFDKH